MEKLDFDFETPLLLREAFQRIAAFSTDNDSNKKFQGTINGNHFDLDYLPLQSLKIEPPRITGYIVANPDGGSLVHARLNGLAGNLFNQAISYIRWVFMGLLLIFSSIYGEGIENYTGPIIIATALAAIFLTILFRRQYFQKIAEIKQEFKKQMDAVEKGHKGYFKLDGIHTVKGYSGFTKTKSLEKLKK